MSDMSQRKDDPIFAIVGEPITTAELASILRGLQAAQENNTTQAQLMSYVRAAFDFFAVIAGRLPTVRQTQELLHIAGLDASLEDIKRCGNDVLHLDAVDGQFSDAEKQMKEDDE